MKNNKFSSNSNVIKNSLKYKCKSDGYFIRKYIIYKSLLANIFFFVLVYTLCKPSLKNSWEFKSTQDWVWEIPKC